MSPVRASLLLLAALAFLAPAGRSSEPPPPSAVGCVLAEDGREAPGHPREFDGRAWAIGVAAAASVEGTERGAHGERQDAGGPPASAADARRERGPLPRLVPWRGPPAPCEVLLAQAFLLVNGSANAHGARA